MSSVIEWIAAEAKLPKTDGIRARRGNSEQAEELDLRNLPAHGFPGISTSGTVSSTPGVAEDVISGQPGDVPKEPATEEFQEDDRERRIYRKRTVEMLRRYMKYSIEAGRLPSVLGKEFFRAKVTAYTVVTFEDRVIFVHDMERCLEGLDEFSRQLIARHILQEHDLVATARLLHCTERTVRRLTPYALDVLSEILLDRKLMERIDSIGKNSCQGGTEAENCVSNCEESENKF